MIWSIDEEICDKNNLKTAEVLALLLVKSGYNITQIFQDLEDKKAIVRDILNNRYMITQRWNDILSTVLLDSDKSKPSEDRVEKLALSLMGIFPKGKKEGTCHYFKGNKKDVSLKLKKFFKLYGHYSDEQILNAAKNYVDSFNGNYSYMRILKYFIWKDEKKVNEEGKIYIEETSDLATWIENEGQSNYSTEFGTLI